MQGGIKLRKKEWRHKDEWSHVRRNEVMQGGIKLRKKEWSNIRMSGVT